MYLNVVSLEKQCEIFLAYIFPSDFNKNMYYHYHFKILYEDSEDDRWISEKGIFRQMNEVQLKI